MSFVLEVRESELFATGATDWWADWRRISEIAGIVTVVSHAVAGDVVRVTLEDAGEAEWLCNTLRDFPHVPMSAIRLVTS